MDIKEKAYSLLAGWKGNEYISGLGIIDKSGELITKYGKNVLLVANTKHMGETAEAVIDSIKKAGGNVITGKAVPGAKPNSPREDAFRIESYILHYKPDCMVALGGGSTIDACKGALVLAALGEKVTPEIDYYFGSGIVSKELESTGKKLIPFIAIETSASSGSHLTKYANITDPVAGQKMLIVDNAVVPKAALFDYESSFSMPVSVSIDGAFDAIAHTMEVFFGAKPDYYDLARDLAETAIGLTVANAGRLIKNPADREAREALGLATDLGGYAIMVGGTSGAHLTSFSLVDVTSHGTACGIMNPYYAVFYSPAIQNQLLSVGNVLKKYGFIDKNPEELEGRERAAAVAEGFIAFGKSINAPTRLSDLEGFSEKHVERILNAAKNPQLSMKLKNMPVPMSAEDVDTYMEPVIRAAVIGDLSLIKNKE